MRERVAIVFLTTSVVATLGFGGAVAYAFTHRGAATVQAGGPQSQTPAGPGPSAPAGGPKSSGSGTPISGGGPKSSGGSSSPTGKPSKTSSPAVGVNKGVIT